MNLKKKIENNISHNNPQQVWQGMKHITNFRGQTNGVVDPTTASAEELNTFLSCFKAPSPQSATPSEPLAASGSQLLTTDYRGSGYKIIFRKAFQSGDVPRNLLRTCALQLSQILPEILTSPRHRLSPYLPEVIH